LVILPTGWLFSRLVGGPAKKAIQASIAGEKPLLFVRDHPVLKKTTIRFSRITDKGIATLVGQIPLKEFPELIAAAAPLLRNRVL
jgi:hypothetical protein